MPRLATTCLIALLLITQLGATYQTTNFVVTAQTPRLAKEIGDNAERCRAIISEIWMGEVMPNWSQPCPINATVAPNLGNGGATSFVFDEGQVFDWRMSIQGDYHRVLDSVLPHEVMHTVLATYYRQPLPRWADEGICSSIEHEDEKAKYDRMLIEQLKTGRSIPLDRMFYMKDYPADVMPIYCQGQSLCRFLLQKNCHHALLQFIDDGLEDDNWPAALREHYGYANISELQYDWLEWVKNGQPKVHTAAQFISNCAECQQYPVIRSQPRRIRVVQPSQSRASNGLTPVQSPWASTQPTQPTQPTRPTRPQVETPTGPTCKDQFAEIKADITAIYARLDSVTGQAGERGPQGPAGKDGADGRDGVDGKDGESPSAQDVAVALMQSNEFTNTLAVQISNNLREQPLELSDEDIEGIARRLPPTRIRVQDRRGEAFSTPYVEFRPGQHITLPFGPQQ